MTLGQDALGLLTFDTRFHFSSSPVRSWTAGVSLMTLGHTVQSLALSVNVSLWRIMCNTRHRPVSSFCLFWCLGIFYLSTAYPFSLSTLPIYANHSQVVSSAERHDPARSEPRRQPRSWWQRAGRCALLRHWLESAAGRCCGAGWWSSRRRCWVGRAI
jgi:hypothetical protein